MANPIQDVELFIGKEWHQFTAWLQAEETKLKPVITIAENVLNGIKDFEISPEGQALEGLLETLIPASTGLVEAFNLQLPVWLVQLKWIENEDNKTLSEQWADAQAYLATIIDPHVYATQFASLKALFTVFFGGDGTNVVNIQQAITLSQPSHSMDSIIGNQ